MKGILAILVLLSICAGASAQKYGGGFYRGYSAPRVVVVPRVSYGIGLGYGGYPYYGYSPYGYPYGYRSSYGYRTSSKLDLQVQSIKLDYKKQIKDTRHDKTLTHTERRSDIRKLKNEREQAIITAQENFSNRRMSNQNRGPYKNGNMNLNNQNDNTINPGNDNSSSSSGTNL